MPESIVKKVTAQCEAGKRPKMCPADMSCGACGEKVAAIVAAKRSKSQSAKGGRMDGDSELTHLHGLYSQDELTYEPIDDGNGVWLRVLDHDAKMIDTKTGRPIQVSQEALMASRAKWISPLYPDIQANIDHNMGSIQKMFSREEFDFLEAKYEINDGLYLKVQPSDMEIRDALLSGALRPSPEFDIEEYEDVGDVVWPTGLGLMWEGTPVSAGSGAVAPSTIAVGGNVMTDENDPVVDPNADPNAVVPPVVPPVEPPVVPPVDPAVAPTEELSAEDKLKAEMDALREEMAGMKTEYEAVLKDNESQKERQDAYEKAEKAKLAAELPDGYPIDGVSLEQARRDHLMHTAQLKAAGKLVAKGPDFVESDKSLNEFTEEDYQEALKAESELFGLSKGMAAGASGASYQQVTGTQYRAPLEGKD